MKNFQNFIPNPNQKVVITFDGNVTLARIYDKNTVVSKGIATCCDEDEFDIKIGSEIALTRALEAMKPKIEPKNQEWVVVNRKPRVGDYIRVTIKDAYEFEDYGEILKVDIVTNSGVHIKIDDHPKCKKWIDETQDGKWFCGDWVYINGEYEVVEPVPKKPEFRKITRLPKAGDYVKLIHSPYTFDKCGDMLKLNEVITHNGHVFCFDIRHADHPNAIADCKRRDVYHHDGYTWHYNWMFTEYEFYEKV